MISKKTALLGVLIAGGLAAVWKIASKPVEDGNLKIQNNSSSNIDTTKGTNDTFSTRRSDMDSQILSTQTEYKTPAGSDKVLFFIIVDPDGTILDASSEALAVNEISKKRQTAFAEGFPVVMKGKKLSELSSIDVVGGSSLTTKAFNESLPKLKSQF